MSKTGPRNVHAWRTRTEEGERREVRALLFGKRWTFEERIDKAPDWTPCPKASLEDLVELRDVLRRKYQRKHLAWDHLQSVEEEIRRRGGAPEDN